MRRRYTTQRFIRLIQRSYAQGWETAVKQYDELQEHEGYRKPGRSIRKGGS